MLMTAAQLIPMPRLVMPQVVRLDAAGQLDAVCYVARELGEGLTRRGKLFPVTVRETSTSDRTPGRLSASWHCDRWTQTLSLTPMSSQLAVGVVVLTVSQSQSPMPELPAPTPKSHPDYAIGFPTPPELAKPLLHLFCDPAHIADRSALRLLVQWITATVRGEALPELPNAITLEDGVTVAWTPGTGILRSQAIAIAGGLRPSIPTPSAPSKPVQNSDNHQGTDQGDTDQGLPVTATDARFVRSAAARHGFTAFVSRRDGLWHIADRHDYSQAFEHGLTTRQALAWLDTL